MSNKPYLITEDFTDHFEEVVKRFRHDRVLVGIPAEDNTREAGKDDGPIGNAALLYLNNFGSPAQNIPTRPVMEIGIRNAQEQIAEIFADGARAALSKGLSALPIMYERAGLVASNSVKKAINSQEGIDEPSEATLAAREARGFKGTKALIVSGQMRNAITYVYRSGI